MLVRKKFFFKLNCFFIHFLLADLLNTLFAPELHASWDTNFVEGRCIDYIKRDADHPYAITILHEQYRLTWPISDRDFVQATTLRYEPKKQRYVLIRKPTPHEKAKSKSFKSSASNSAVVRGLVYAGWLIDELSPSSCRYTQVAYLDLCGMVPAKLWNSVIKLRGDESHRALLKVLKEQQKKGFPAPVDSDRVFETLAENSMAASPITPLKNMF